MFYGYPISQWLGVVEWFIIMIFLGIGTFTVSCILTNKMLHKKKRRITRKKIEKKSWFIDVA